MDLRDFIVFIVVMLCCVGLAYCRYPNLLPSVFSCSLHSSVLTPVCAVLWRRTWGGAMAPDAITNENYLTILVKLSESAVGVSEYVESGDDEGADISYFNSGEVFLRLFFGVVVLVVVLNMVIAKFSATCE